MAMPAGEPRSDRAFERLYRRHIDEVFRYAFAVLGNRADAEDVTQTAFLNAYRAFQSGQRPDRPLNWLIAITHNVCRQRFRDAARQPREVVFDDELAADSEHDESRRFGQEDITRALSQLSFSQRAALAMRELEGRSYREIAQILEITEAAVETLIFRARRAFREQLEGSLSCNEAERAISRQLDGMLPRGEKGGLRAHLRACGECASLARRLRAQRSALRGIAVLPLPQSLVSFSGAGGSVAGGAGAALGTGLGLKIAAFGAATLVVAGVSTNVVTGSAPHSAQGATPAPRVAEQSTLSSLAERRIAALNRQANATWTRLRTGSTNVRSGATPKPVLPGVSQTESTGAGSSGTSRPTSASGHAQPTGGTVHPELPAAGTAAGTPLGAGAANGNGTASGGARGSSAKSASTSQQGSSDEHPAKPTKPDKPDKPPKPDQPEKPTQQPVSGPASEPHGGGSPPVDAEAATEQTEPEVILPPQAQGDPPAEPPGNQSAGSQGSTNGSSNGNGGANGNANGQGNGTAQGNGQGKKP